MITKCSSSIRCASNKQPTHANLTRPVACSNTFVCTITGGVEGVCIFSIEKLGSIIRRPAGDRWGFKRGKGHNPGGEVFKGIYCTFRQGYRAGSGTGLNGIHLGSPESELYLDYGSGSKYKKMKQTTKKKSTKVLMEYLGIVFSFVLDLVLDWLVLNVNWGGIFYCRIYELGQFFLIFKEKE